MKRIGPTFHAELLAAGLAGLPFAWSADGGILFDGAMPQDKRDAVLAVYDAHDPEAQPAPSVPAEVTMRQARLALLAVGKLADVNTAIDAMPEPDRTAARIEWEYSGTVQRSKPLVQALAPALGLTEAQMDELFTQAAKL